MTKEIWDEIKLTTSSPEEVARSEKKRISLAHALCRLLQFLKLHQQYCKDATCFCRETKGGKK